MPGIFRRVDIVKIETEPFDRAQDVFSGISLQSGEFGQPQDQYGPPKNIGRRRREDMERRRRKRGQILAFQVGQAPGEGHPE